MKVNYQRLKYLMLSTALFFMLFTSAGLAKDTAPCLSTLWPHEKSDLKPDPALVFGKLPSGFRYVLMENREPKDRVSLRLNIQAGALNETDEQQGLAHYLEHMMFNGSEHFPPGELVKYFQSIGMNFGADANAHTAFSETVYEVLLPKGTESDLKGGLQVMRDYAGGALLLESEIERERGIILAEKRDRDSVWYRTYVETIKFIFDGTKIPERHPIGSEDVIKKADRRLLKDYYDTWYRPENMMLVMVGDFDTKTAEALIKSAFADLTARAPARDCPDIGTVSHEGIKPLYHFEKEAGSTRTSLQAVWNTEPRPDSFEYQKELITRYLADSIVNNRLEAMTEKADNPFTSAYIYSGVFLGKLGYAKLSAESAPKNWEKVLTVLEQTLRRTLLFGFTASELDRAKKEFLADLDEAVLKKDTRDSEELSTLIIDNINDDKVFQSPEQEKELYSPVVESLTLKQVHDAFASVWNQNHRLLMVTGNAKIEEKDKTPQAVIREVFDESAKTKVEKPAEKETIQFPYLPEPEKSGKIREHKKFPDLGIEQTDFENGVRLNLKQTDFKKNEVMAVISFGWGKKTEPVPGLAMLAESVLGKSGLGHLTENELDQSLAGKNTQVEFRIKENQFSLEGKGVSQEVPLLFQLLYAHLKDPGYRKEAYLLSMRQFEQMYKELSHTIDGAMALSGEKFLAGGDSRFGSPSYEALRKLDLEQVRSWIDPARTGKLEISVVGDFDPESVKNLAARYFGSLPPQTDPEEKKESLKFPAGEKLTLSVETAINKGMAVIAWPTEDFSDIHRVRRLSVLGSVLKDRLREEIRENLGATYSQYAYNNSSRTYEGYGVLRAVLLVDPDMSEKIVGEVRKLAADLAKKGVDEEELRRALDPTLTGIKDMMRTNRYWLGTVLDLSARFPEQLQWCRSIQQDYAAITAQDVSELAAQYLDNKNAAIILIKPE
jgi:zinc protease